MPIARWYTRLHHHGLAAQPLYRRVAAETANSEHDNEAVNGHEADNMGLFHHCLLLGMLESELQYI